MQPRASRSEVIGEQEGALRVRVTGPPVQGAANDAVVELLARLLRVAKRNVRIVTGTKSRRKVVEVDGVSAEAVRALHSAHPEDPEDPEQP